MHTVIAALLAIPLRANVAVAAAFTLLVNPLTIPPMYYAAYRIGSWELHHDATLVNPATAEHVSGELARFLFWIHEASGPIALGILTIAASRRCSAMVFRALLWRRGSGANGANGGTNGGWSIAKRAFAGAAAPIVDWRWRARSAVTGVRLNRLAFEGVWKWFEF